MAIDVRTGSRRRYVARRSTIGPRQRAVHRNFRGTIHMARRVQLGHVRAWRGIGVGMTFRTRYGRAVVAYAGQMGNVCANPGSGCCRKSCRVPSISRIRHHAVTE